MYTLTVWQMLCHATGLAHYLVTSSFVTDVSAAQRYG